jgi:hypothetical protein
MKISIVRFVLVCSVLATLVFGAVAQNQPEVEVVKFSWRKLPKSSVPSGKRTQEMRNAHINATIAEERRKREPDYREIVRLDRQKKNQVTPLDPPTPLGKDYEYKAKFRNVSSKEITGLTWIYIFKDAATGQELMRHRFESKVKIKAGKEKGLKSYSNSHPLDILSEEAKKKKAWKEEVLIERVEYSDGSK